MTLYDYPLGAGAVLYADHGGRGPELWEVVDVYDARDGTDTWVRLTDGTHTEQRWLTITDVRELFTPAGWQAETKPTYTMTRAYGHKCYPKDLMNGQMYETETKGSDRV